MSNSVSGRVTFEVEGRAYALVLDVNALIELEGVLGVKAGDITGKIGHDGLSLTEVRALLWAGLQREHPDVSLPAAGALVQALTPKVAVLKAIEAVAAAFPGKPAAKAEDAPGDATPPHPPKETTKAGTG